MSIPVNSTTYTRTSRPHSRDDIAAVAAPAAFAEPIGGSGPATRPRLG